MNIHREGLLWQLHFLLKIKLDDWVWLKTHIHDENHFDRIGDSERFESILPYVSGIRKDIDPGIVINFMPAF